jgi:hypothetical protein
MQFLLMIMLKKGILWYLIPLVDFWNFGGTISLAGDLVMADVSIVIDLAFTNTHADSSLTGLSGISYGGV